MSSAPSLALVALLLAPTIAMAQETSPGTEPRTPWGHPDLQGVWDFRSLTPLERPDGLEKQFLTDEEAAEFVSATPERNRAFLANVLGDRDVGQELWDDTGSALTDDNRTSLIVDPADGKVPRTEANQAAMFEVLGNAFLSRPDSHEDRLSSERCFQWTPTPLLPTFSNNNVQIFQTPDAIVLLHEMVHDIRVIYLDDRPHLADHMRQLRGSSRGHWEGDTLVVESTNFNDEAGFLFASPNRLVVERFSRTDVNSIRYEYTIDDPDAFSEPWTAVLPLKKTELPIYEYDCHEGNRSITVMLEAARAEDAAEANTKK